MSNHFLQRLVRGIGVRLGFVLSLVVLCSAVFAAGANAAAGARWTISSAAAPTYLAPGDSEDFYSLQAITVGNAPGLSGRVTLSDALPAGVAPTEAVGYLQLVRDHAVSGPSIEKACAIVGQEVSCTFETNELEGQNELILPPGTLAVVTVGITASVSPDARGSVINSARIEGGGYAPAETTESNLVSVDPVPAGLSYSESEVVNEDGSTATQAAAHPYELISRFRFNVGAVQPPSKFEPGLSGATPISLPVSSLRDIEFSLPPGIVGNPLSGPRCSQREFQTTQSEVGCPASTQVGQIGLRFYGSHGATRPDFRPVYNIEPGDGQPAELGFSVSALIHVPILFDVRSNGDYGLTAYLRGVNGGDPVETAVLNIWGNPGSPAHDLQRDGSLGIAGESCQAAGCPAPPEASFLTMPSACSAGLSAGIAADFYKQPGAMLAGGGADLADPNWTSFATPLLDAVGGCDALSLNSAAGSPSLDVHPNGSTSAKAPSGYDVDLRIPQEEDPHTLATPTLKDVSVTMPKGTVVSASSAQGLGACSEDQIELHSKEPLKPGTCPDSSKLGTAEIFTPLLTAPLKGSLFLAQQGNAGPGQGSNPFGSLLAVYLEASGSGVIVKLPGRVDLDQATGQVTASFENNPQLPFDEIKVHLFDGSHAALANPSSCGPASASTALTPHSSSSATTVAGAQFEVGSCAPAKFAPSFRAGDTGTKRGGAYGPIVTSFSRDDSDDLLSGISVKLPEGLLAKIAGVTECGEAQANAGTCPVSSQIGSTTVSAGPGPSPITLPQPGRPANPVYLTGPYKGAAFGLSVVTPAVAGPFDLGTVVVRASLAVDPETAQVTATSDPLPTMLQGVPLDIRTVTLNIDRPEFTVNPTDCDGTSIAASITSTVEAVAKASSSYQASDCAALSFKPGLKLSLRGSTKRIGHPALKAVVTYPKGGSYANIGRAQVNLPHSEFLDQGNLNKTCTRPVLLAGKCPKTSVYGHAKAWTPLLEKPLEGPVYLVGGFGFKLPALVAELNGQLRVLLKGKVDSGPNKGIRNTFEAVPDAPVSRFVLELKGGGKYGLLENSANLCQRPQRAIARFTGQNGKVESFKPLVHNQCGKKKAGRTGKRKRG